MKFETGNLKLEIFNHEIHEGHENGKEFLQKETEGTK